MRTIIAGSRRGPRWPDLATALAACGWTPTVVVSGTAAGADQLGEQWARLSGVPVERFPADWGRYGRSAGHKRNAVMAEHAEALIALWDGQSKGTKGMIDLAQRKGLRVYVQRVGAA